MNREAAARKIQAAWARKRAPKPSEFVNKFTNFDYALTKPVVTSTIISLDVPFRDLSGAPLPKGAKELLGYTATGQLPVVRKLKNRPEPLGAANIAKVKRWAFTIDFTAPDYKAYVSHMDSGKMQISTTGPYERVIRLLTKTYYPGIINAQIKIVKIDTRMHVNRSINLDGLGEELVRKVPKSKLLKWDYTPELMPGAYLKWSDPRASLIIYTNGAILTQGLKSLDDLGSTSEILKQIFTKYLVDRFKVFKYMRGPWGTNYMGMAAPPVPARKNLAKKRAQGANRYSLATNWNNNREGFYVRPGANAKPRFYPLVANLKLVKPKMIRAYTNAGVPIPQKVRNLFGITGNAAPAPAPKAEGRRAPNWSATKNGYYVKPGPGGQPYFYQMPKGLAAARKTVMAAYEKAGVNIPNAVRVQFKIGNAPAKTANEPTGNWKKPTHWLNYNGKGELRINGRQYDRYTRAELVQIARNIGIPEVSEGQTLKKISELIAKRLAPYTNAPNAVVNGVPVILMPNGRVKRGARARQWATLKANEQTAIAMAMLNSFKLAEYEKVKKNFKFNYLLGVKSQLAEEARNEAVAGLANEAAESARSVSSTGSNFANFTRNLELAMVAQGALGDNANAATVNKFVNILKGLPSGARGMPLKATIEKAARNFKRSSLVNTQLTNIKRNYAAAIKVPNWLPSNLRNSYKNHLLRLGTTPNAKGALPAPEAVKRGMKGWLNAHLPTAGRASYERENIETGKVTRVRAWDPTKRRSPNIPNVGVKRVGPERKKRAPKPKQPVRMNGAATGPVKPAKKDPRENKNYAVPRNANAENLVNAIANLGLNIGPTNRYSWTYLTNKGLNNRFYENWMNYAASPIKELTVNSAKNQLNGLKTAKARQEWLVAHRSQFGKNNYRALLNHRQGLNQKNKNRRAAAREAR
jgi:TATA-box binding protein (TBP) (component of TFIID and TFIIIB)